MRLLVSAMNAADAAAALAGEADIIDAKDPSAGALGAVSLEVFRAIAEVTRGRRPLSAALGDAVDPARVEEQARAFAMAGADFVKVGFAGVSSPCDIAALLAAAVRGVSASRVRTQVTAVAYADSGRVNAPEYRTVLDAARLTGATGILIDTADKSGPGLMATLSIGEIAAWVTSAHDAGLSAAVAGKLSDDDVGRIGMTGADIAGVRGAACIGGRGGLISATRVSTLRARCGGARPLAQLSR